MRRVEAQQRQANDIIQPEASDAKAAHPVEKSWGRHSLSPSDSGDSNPSHSSHSTRSSSQVASVLSPKESIKPIPRPPPSTFRAYFATTRDALTLDGPSASDHAFTDDFGLSRDERNVDSIMVTAMRGYLGSSDWTPMSPAGRVVQGFALFECQFRLRTTPESCPPIITIGCLLVVDSMLHLISLCPAGEGSRTGVPLLLYILSSRVIIEPGSATPENEISRALTLKASWSSPAEWTGQVYTEFRDSNELDAFMVSICLVCPGRYAMY